LHLTGVQERLFGNNFAGHLLSRSTGVIHTSKSTSHGVADISDSTPCFCATPANTTEIDLSTEDAASAKSLQAKLKETDRPKRASHRVVSAERRTAGDYDALLI
jgi:hypothetical protein